MDGRKRMMKDERQMVLPHGYARMAMNELGEANGTDEGKTGRGGIEGIQTRGERDGGEEKRMERAGHPSRGKYPLRVTSYTTMSIAWRLSEPAQIFATGLRRIR